jgi:acyl-CoA synthetase (AMP-forming)/AMP-acid ligase II
MFPFATVSMAAFQVMVPESAGKGPPRLPYMKSCRRTMSRLQRIPSRRHVAQGRERWMRRPRHQASAEDLRSAPPRAAGHPVARDSWVPTHACVFRDALFARPIAIMLARRPALERPLSLNPSALQSRFAHLMLTDVCAKKRRIPMYPGAHALARPDHPAVVMADSGATISYAELDSEANRLARLFRDAGLLPGDHVAFCLENHPRFLPICWGAHYAGLIYTAMSSRLTTDEMAYIIDNCGARVFITSTYKKEQASELVEHTPTVELRLMLDGTVPGYQSYEAALDAASSEPLQDRVAGYDMLYSSGTTGRPKGILPKVEPKPLEEAGSAVKNLVPLFGINESSIYLSPAPLYHAAPLRFCLAVQMFGGTVVVMERFDAEDYLAAVDRHRVTQTQLVPTMLVRMLKLPDEVRSRYDVSSLQAAVHAAAPCPVVVKRKMIDWWGPILHEYYAGTEGNGFVYCNSEDWLAHPGTVGKALIGTLHIVGEDDEPVPTGETGTIYFSDGGTFEYHGDPDKTAASRMSNGWSTLGDIGRLDEDGFLYLTDRKAYMIISGGVNIYPQEAENILTMHPRVADVAVIGVPNEDFGEEVKAIVQPVEMPASDGEASALERTLIAFCREQLADIKCPRSVDFRAELPRHPTGKLYKRLLKDEYWAESDRKI